MTRKWKDLNKILWKLNLLNFNFLYKLENKKIIIKYNFFYFYFSLLIQFNKKLYIKYKIFFISYFKIIKNIK